MSEEISKNFENITKNLEENVEKTNPPIVSYLSLVYIRATPRAIREETIFVDASSGRLNIYIQTW